MKCQLVIVPAKHPHLRGEGGREDGGGRELTGREMTPWIPPSLTLSLIEFIFLSVFFLLFSYGCTGDQAVCPGPEGISCCVPMHILCFLLTK